MIVFIYHVSCELSTRPDLNLELCQVKNSLKKVQKVGQRKALWAQEVVLKLIFFFYFIALH